MNICCKGDSKVYKKIDESAELLKAISEPNRLRLLCVLSKEKVCVCDLGERLSMQQNLVSFHLKTLFEAGILEKYREGNNIYYMIKEEWKKKVESIFEFLDIK